LAGVSFLISSSLAIGVSALTSLSALISFSALISASDSGFGVAVVGLGEVVVAGLGEVVVAGLGEVVVAGLGEVVVVGLGEVVVGLGEFVVAGLGEAELVVGVVTGLAVVVGVAGLLVREGLGTVACSVEAVGFAATLTLGVVTWGTVPVGFGVVGVDPETGLEITGVDGLFNAPLVCLTGLGVPGFEDKPGFGFVLGRLVNLFTRSIKMEIN